MVRENLQNFILLLEAGIFFYRKKKRGNHNPFFLRKQTKGHWCKTSPNNSIGGSARHWLFPPPWRHISFPGLCFSYLGEFFFPQAKHEQWLSGKWRLNFTWRFLPAWSSGTQVSGPASVSRGISPTASRRDSVFWKGSELGRNGARSPWQFSQRRWGGGIKKSQLCPHCWNYSPKENKWPARVFQMPQHFLKWHLYSREQGIPRRNFLVLYNSLGHSPCSFPIRLYFVFLCLKVKENTRNIIKGDEELQCVLFRSCYLAGRSEYFHGRAGQIKWKHTEKVSQPEYLTF